ncbi:hypothetical protein DTO169C6_8600 [Paecilomyces variotii]|nr:hypothetical protein DTO169C6_8600 [Paecilomyces variotii]
MRDQPNPKGQYGFETSPPPSEDAGLLGLNKDIRQYVRKKDAEGRDDEPWLSKQELPSSDEIMGTEMENDDFVALMPNRILGPWPSSGAYLRAHYELLREDAVAPLRDAVAYVKDDPHMMDSPLLNIYEKVYITGITFAQKGVAVKVRFSTARAGKNIVWEYTKRLMSGTIVALSPANDCFQSKCVVAVVAARPLEGVKQQPPEIDLLFARAEDADFDPQQEWIMVEAKTGYYEAHRHTMTALQKMATESFPLAEHICRLGLELQPPEYLTADPRVNMEPIFPDDAGTDEINVLEAWPQTPMGNLDSSQWAALNQILTKELALIQGPPGTGKTFVSVVALKVILTHMREGDPPVILAAQTNHALDQLLRHVSMFQGNYIRLGGRSTDVDIKKRTLFEIRKKLPLQVVPGGLLGPARKELKRLIDEISALLKPFNQENSGSPLPASFFLKVGVMSQSQFDSLERGAQGWVRGGSGSDSDPIVNWLGDYISKFEVIYDTENFGFSEDDIDLEYEQLKELEAEQGIEDDDLEILRGTFTHLKESFMGRGIPSLSEKTIQEVHLRRHDLWRIPANVRGSVYNTLRRLAKEKITGKLRQFLRLYDDCCVDLQIGKWERDYNILKSAKVIGMTTTGLSKYRALVSSLKPKIVMVEEAAEVIEGPVAVACIESLQHLILVGDHKQLQGHCSVQELEGEPFFLNVSMFERLVHNGIDFRTLTRQRRMAPEIRKLLSPIYSDLQDHPSVLDRPKIPGMGDSNTYFFHHTWPESSDNLSSKYNQDEAQMIVGFYFYLVLNGMSVNDITVLTFYNGQRKKILKLLKDHQYLQGQYVKVVTVDSYQGEENEVVILSLVRSSERANIGFLSIENRVCVALSRAKRGFYIFGNGEAVSLADPLWWEIVCIMGEDQSGQRRLGRRLPLTCVKHGRRFYIRELKEWHAINGGCELKCGEVLSCGHTCELRCHSFSHDQVSCNQICGKPLACGHVCREHCSTGHPCHCECKPPAVEHVTIERLAIERLAMEEVRPTVRRTATNSSIPEEKHTELVQKYHKFVNGGAQEQDAFLNARAKDMASEELKQQLDDEAFRDLFGGENENTASKSSKPRRAPSTKRVPDGKGGYRERYVDYFSARTTPSRTSKESSPGQHLLDNSD